MWDVVDLKLVHVGGEEKESRVVYVFVFKGNVRKLRSAIAGYSGRQVKDNGRSSHFVDSIYSNTGEELNQMEKEIWQSLFILLRRKTETETCWDQTWKISTMSTDESYVSCVITPLRSTVLC